MTLYQVVLYNFELW